MNTFFSKQSFAESKIKITLVKVSDWNSFWTNQIYSKIFIRAKPNLSESIRKKFSISFDVIRDL